MLALNCNGGELLVYYRSLGLTDIFFIQLLPAIFY